MNEIGGFEVDFSQIKQLYPTASLSDHAYSNEKMVTFPYKNKWLHIEEKQISKKEQTLLEMLLKQVAEETQEFSQSKWSAFLTGEITSPPQTNSSIRMIQIKIEKKDTQFDASLLLESIRSLFDPVLDASFLNEHLCLVIQDEKADFFTPDEIHGMLQTLEEDFSLRTICYIGQYWEPDLSLRNLLQEEQAIFTDEAKHLNDRVASLADVAIRHFTTEALFKSTLMQKLKERLEEQEEWKELIQALWESQGNVSVAAKSLYVHRNTLQYRMDKFYETTGLSLKNINELLLCYLLIL